MDTMLKTPYGDYVVFRIWRWFACILGQAREYPRHLPLPGDPGWLLAFPAAQLIDLQSECYRAGMLGHELD
jgi:hypothetical protein